jgi:hypothetical protein
MSQKDATVIAREIQDMAQAMAESMTSVAETVKAAVAVTHGQARGEAGQIVQLADARAGPSVAAAAHRRARQCARAAAAGHQPAADGIDGECAGLQ